MKKLVTSILAALALAAVPVGAMAQTSVSSNDGFGFVNPVTRYGDGVYMGGSLQSTAGNPVYFSGFMTYNNALDGPAGRYSTDTSHTGSYVARPGTIGNATSGHAADGAKVRVCRNRNNLPDPCGSWSSKIAR